MRYNLLVRENIGFGGHYPRRESEDGMSDLKTDLKLQVIPLGGLGEFGMNMTAIRYG